ncbi:MAG: winged helix-turn-helix domain-containing protein [Rubrivivax sp.]|nr:winged helix-turn-helix domain-containing protein [Rubrivivax sp.]
MNLSERPVEATVGDSIHLAVGDFRLDLGRRRLLDARGATVELSPRLFDALVYFVERRGELLDKDTLLADLWPGQVVEENNLNKLVSALRRALGDDGNDKRYLLTVPRRGFRFVADVHAVVAATGPVAGASDASASAAATAGAMPATARPRRWVFALAGAAGAAVALGVGLVIGPRLWRADAGSEADTPVSDPTPPTTLAVLPFRPLAGSGSARDEVLELGMADSLIARLSAARGVIVRPVGAVRRYAGQDTDALQAARDLGVGWVVEGTMAQQGERLRVTARLLDVRNGSAAWSGTFDETFTHVFDVQEAISRRVAEVLMPRLGERERGALGVAGTRSAETYRLYLEARYLSLLFTADAYRRSIALYEQAIAADPRYAYAWCGLADVLRRELFTSNKAPRQTFERIRAAAQRAVDIDPRLGEGQAILGWVAYLYDWDWLRAEQAFTVARELNPSAADAHHGLAHVHMSHGRAAEALRGFVRAREIEPHSVLANAFEGGALASMGRLDEGIAQIRRALQIGPGFWIGHLIFGNVMFNAGQSEAALASLQRAVELSGGSAWASGPFGFALGETGHADRARAVLRGMQAQGREGFISPAMMALVHVALGEHDAALTALERAYEERDIRLAYLQLDHRWAAVRGQARFVALAERLGFDSKPPQARCVF